MFLHRKPLTCAWLDNPISLLAHHGLGGRRALRKIGSRRPCNHTSTIQYWHTEIFDELQHGFPGSWLPSKSSKISVSTRFFLKSGKLPSPEPKEKPFREAVFLRKCLQYEANCYIGSHRETRYLFGDYCIPQTTTKILFLLYIHCLHKLTSRRLRLATPRICSILQTGIGCSPVYSRGFDC